MSLIITQDIYRDAVLPSIVVGNPSFEEVSFYGRDPASILKTIRALRPGAENDYIPDIWKTSGSGKLLWEWRTPSTKLSPEQVTVIGGVCSLYTAESETLRTKSESFESIDEFRAWLMSWYPRIDQIRDAVGVPPRATSKIMYVCEDSFFAERVSKWTGLDVGDLNKVFREVHMQKGEPAIKKWLSLNG